MATPQETKRDAMSKVNGVLAALDLYPDTTPVNTQLSYSASANPVDLLIDFFKSTKGYDWLVNAVSLFITIELPVIELAVKGILLDNIRTMLSCSVNPIITERMINEGFVFDLNRIDLFNIFNYSPLNRDENNPGKYYYFGCTPEDGIEVFDDLRYTRDFNALLWYSKNNPGERIVWRREGDLNKPVTHGRKQVKSNGITTIEFNGRASGLSNSEHDMSNPLYVSAPVDNCLHVFIGNCSPNINNGHEQEIIDCTKKLAKFDKLSKQCDEYESKIIESQRNERTNAIERGADADELNNIDMLAEVDRETIDTIRWAINETTQNPSDGIVDILQIRDYFENDYYYIQMESLRDPEYYLFKIPNDIADTTAGNELSAKIQYMQANESRRLDYPSATSNYYFLHPLFEWNTDFIMSMKLFDEKVVAAQLIDSLTNCLRFAGGMAITAQAQFLQSQIRDLIERVIETDDATINDCFFSFTNEGYNRLLNETELHRMNLNPLNDNTVNNIPSPDDIMESLNTLSPDASREELQSAISGSLFSATSASPHEFGRDGELMVDVNVNMSIIDQMLNNLVYVVVSALMQPKIYILLMANLKFLGNEPNFDLMKFMQQFSDLMSAMIKSVRDSILEYFTNQLLLIMNELVKTLAVKMSLEQYQYYITLLTSCLLCFKTHKSKGDVDWVQDDVDYADITELNQIESEEC